MRQQDTPYQHILVAIDLSSNSQRVINKAVKLARSLNTKLSLISVNHLHDSHYLL